VLTAGLFAAIAIWSFVLIVSDPITEDVSGFTLKTELAGDVYCGRQNNTELYLDPAFMDVGAAGNSVIDIMFSLLMAIGMLSYYLPAVKNSELEGVEKWYSGIAYVFLCAASLTNAVLCIFVCVYLGGHQSPFSNTDTRIKAIANIRVTVMALVALQLALAGALSVSSRKTKEGKDSFFKAEPDGEPELVVVAHRVLQFLFATLTFVGAVVLAFSTAAFHHSNPGVSVAGNMLCRSESDYDQVATGTALFSFLLPYMLSAWWDMTKI
jgi:hypothetical protein